MGSEARTGKKTFWPRGYHVTCDIPSVLSQSLNLLKNRINGFNNVSKQYTTYRSNENESIKRFKVYCTERHLQQNNKNDDYYSNLSSHPPVSASTHLHICSHTFYSSSFTRQHSGSLAHLYSNGGSSHIFYR